MAFRRRSRVTSRGDWGSASAHGYDAGASPTSGLFVLDLVIVLTGRGLVESWPVPGYLASSASFASSSRCFCAGPELAVAGE